MSAVHSTTRRSAPDLLAWAAIGLFFVLAVAYSFVVPPFETPDEPFHYAFARHLAQGNALPVQGAESGGPWEQEGSQAPLYYALTGALTSGIDQSDFPALNVVNPRANIGDPLFPGNKNRMLYSGAARPLVGANLAAHVGRWFSALLGALSLWLTWRTARLAWPARPWLPALAVIYMAAIPQFAFLSGSFTNDTLMITTSAAALWWATRLVVRDDGEPIAWWEWAALGFFVGLGALTKLHGLGLVGLAGGVALWLAWRRRSWRLLLGAALGVGLPALALAGWWYGRNALLYGDLFGVSHLLDINGRREPIEDFAALWHELRGLRYSYWGLFGWFNILAPAWFYVLMDALALLALAGGAFAAVRRLRGGAQQGAVGRAFAVLWLWVLISLALLAYWISQATGSQGRLLFPALGALSILLVAGLDELVRHAPSRLRPALWAVAPTAMVVCSLYALGWLLPAVYRAPAPVAAPPPAARPVNVTFGEDEAIRLVALDSPVAGYASGDELPVTLYLTADAPLARDYQVFIQLLDETGSEIGNMTSHTGWGRNPTSLWQPGALYADPYVVRIGAIDPRSPVLADLYVGFVRPDSEEKLPLPARDGSGAEITPFLGQVALKPLSPPELADYGLQPGGSEFGGVIRLAGYAFPAEARPGETVTPQVMWEAMGTPATEYTAFAHLVAAGTQAAGWDQSPAGDRYPTSVWQAGDRIVSDYPLVLPAGLPPGEYELWVGLYEADSQGSVRLPVSSAAGLTSGDGQVLLGTILVQPE